MVEDRVGNILDMITVDELADVLGVTLDLESDDEKTKDDIYSAKKYYGEDVDRETLYMSILKNRVISELETLKDNVNTLSIIVDDLNKKVYNDDR